MTPPFPKPVMLEGANRRPWLIRLSTRHIVWAGVLVAFAVFTAGGVLDWLVRRGHVPQHTLMLGGALVSLACGSLVCKVLFDARARRRALLQRLELIGEMNHHIRNALQVIAYYNFVNRERGDKAIEDVRAAVTRIEWALREVLTNGAMLPESQRSTDSGSRNTTQMGPGK